MLFYGMSIKVQTVERSRGWTAIALGPYNLSEQVILAAGLGPGLRGRS